MKFEIAPKSTEIRANWEEARLYCFSLNINGKTGWRLPNIEELCEIYQSEIYFGQEWHWYWSSTQGNGDTVWLLDFNDGYQYYDVKTNGYYVRAIRDLS